MSNFPLANWNVDLTLEPIHVKYVFICLHLRYGLGCTFEGEQWEEVHCHSNMLL